MKYSSFEIQLLLICLQAIFLAGCGSEPFQRASLPLLDHPNPQAIRQQFPTLLPDEFTTDDTVSLKFPFHDDLVMLGVLNVNRPAGRFEFYALNQAGIPYFHLSGDRSGNTVRDALGPWMEHKDILLGIAADIGRIYLTLAPRPDSPADIKLDQVIFTEKTADGIVVYNYGMLPTVLLEKQVAGFFGARWHARYYDYRPGNGGKLFPHGIVMDNNQFHYRLIIKNRDWSVDEKE